MTPRGKNDLKKLFAECDRDGDGMVTQAEWKAACTKPTLKRVFSGADADELANAFHAVDTDGSGTITWDEFEAASRSLYMSRTLAAATVSDSGKAGLEALFKSLDENGDRYVPNHLPHHRTSSRATPPVSSRLQPFPAVSNRLQVTGRSHVMNGPPRSTRMRRCRRLEPSHVCIEFAHSQPGTLSRDGTQAYSAHRATCCRQLIKFFGGAKFSELKEAFDRIDTNRSGSLSWEEWANETRALRAARVEGRHSMSRVPALLAPLWTVALPVRLQLRCPLRSAGSRLLHVPSW